MPLVGTTQMKPHCTLGVTKIVWLPLSVGDAPALFVTAIVHFGPQFWHPKFYPEPNIVGNPVKKHVASLMLFDGF